MASGKQKTAGAISWKKYILPAAFVLIPLVQVPSFLDPATLPRQILWAGVLTVWMLTQFSRKPKSGTLAVPKLPLFLSVSIAVVLLAHLLSMSAAHNIAESIHTTSRNALTFLGMYILTWQMTEEGKPGKNTWMTVVWGSGALQGILVLIQFITNSGAIPDGTLINSNIAGAFITVCLPFAIWVTRHGVKFLRIPAGVTVLCSLIAIYLTESRTSLLILLFYAVALLPLGLKVLLSKSSPIAARWKWIIPFAVVILISGAWSALYIGWGRKEMPKTFGHLFNNNSTIYPGTSSSEVRLVLWNKSIQMGKAHPVTGVGAGNWKLEAPRYGVKGFDSEGRYASIFFIRPHNDFLWLFAETGWPGLVGFSGFLICLIAVAVKKKPEDSTAADRGIVLAALFGLWGYIINAFFAFPSERMEDTIILGVCSAIILTTFPRVQKAAPIVIPIRTFTSIALVFLVFVLYKAFVCIPSDIATQKMRTAKQKKNWKTVQKYANIADGFWTHYEAPTATPIAWYRAMATVEQARAISPGGNPAGSPQALNMLQEALEEVELALELAPYNYNAMNERASTLAFLGRHKEAITAYQDVIRIFSDDWEAHVNLGICYFNDNNAQAAKETVQQIPIWVLSPNLDALNAALGK